MNFVCSSNAFSIDAIGGFKYFKTLMNKYIVNHEICKTITENTDTNWQCKPNIIFTPDHSTTNTNSSIENKKQVISFKPAVMIFFVVIGMNVP